MFLVLLSMFGLADTPKASAEITVEDSRYEEIYVEDIRVMSNGKSVSIYEYDNTSVFTYMNQKHRSWFRAGKISGIYNSETIGFVYDGCDYSKTALKCANEDGLWVLRTVINESPEQASINLLLFDEYGTVVGQSNVSKSKKVTIVERQKTVQTQQPGQPISVSTNNCNQQAGSCLTGGSYSGIQQGPTQTLTEDLEPTIIERRPRIRDIDVDRAVIMLYDSVRK